jgi:hypothetical protein
MRWMIRNFLLPLSLIHVRIIVVIPEELRRNLYHMNTKAASALIDLQVTADYGKEVLNKQAWSATAKWASAKTTVWRASLVSKCYLDMSLSIPPVVLLLLALGVVCGISGGVFLALQNRGTQWAAYTTVSSTDTKLSLPIFGSLHCCRLAHMALCGSSVLTNRCGLKVGAMGSIFQMGNKQLTDFALHVVR